MGGVFSIGDLQNLFNENNPVLLNRRIRSLIQEQILQRFKREFYITEQCNMEILSQRIYEDSYISLGSACARHFLIGSVPSKTVYAVKSGKNRIFQSAIGTILFCGIAKHLLFGFEYENGIRYADAEKAVLDVLYFHTKGFRFSFNIFTDIAFSQLSREKITAYLKKYKNPKYVSYVKGVLHDQSS